jgi:hypothetical protein
MMGAHGAAFVAAYGYNGLRGTEEFAPQFANMVRGGMDIGALPENTCEFPVIGAQSEDQCIKNTKIKFSRKVSRVSPESIADVVKIAGFQVKPIMKCFKDLLQETGQQAKKKFTDWTGARVDPGHKKFKDGIGVRMKFYDYQQNMDKIDVDDTLSKLIKCSTGVSDARTGFFRTGSPGIPMDKTGDAGKGTWKLDTDPVSELDWQIDPAFFDIKRIWHN